MVQFTAIPYEKVQNPFITKWAHKKVSRDLTEKKQDLTEMSIILMVLTKI